MRLTCEYQHRGFGSGASTAPARAVYAGSLRRRAVTPSVFVGFRQWDRHTESRQPESSPPSQPIVRRYNWYSAAVLQHLLIKGIIQRHVHLEPQTCARSNGLTSVHWSLWFL
jgi:hypothetical protein